MKISPEEFERAKDILVAETQIDRRDMKAQPHRNSRGTGEIVLCRSKQTVPQLLFRPELIHKQKRKALVDMPGIWRLKIKSIGRVEADLVCEGNA